MPRFGRFPVPFAHDRNWAALVNCRADVYANDRTEDAANLPGTFTNVRAAIRLNEPCVLNPANPDTAVIYGRDAATASHKFGFLRVLTATIGDVVTAADPDGKVHTYILVAPVFRVDLERLWLAFVKETTV